MTGEHTSHPLDTLLTHPFLFVSLRLSGSPALLALPDRHRQVVQHLAAKTTTLVPALLQHVPKEKSLSRLALTSLVNISQEPRVLEHLLEIKMCNRAMDYLREKTCPGNEDLLIMLLANITTDERGAEQLLQIGQGAKEGLHLAFLLGYFLSPPSTAADNDGGYLIGTGSCTSHPSP